MTRRCELCDKKARRANHVSHSNIKKPRRQKPNLQNMHTNGVCVKVCSTCRRTLSKKASK